jgi:hypothetical protein
MIAYVEVTHYSPRSANPEAAQRIVYPATLKGFGSLGEEFMSDREIERIIRGECRVLTRWSRTRPVEQRIHRVENGRDRTRTYDLTDVNRAL